MIVDKFALCLLDNDVTVTAISNNLNEWNDLQILVHYLEKVEEIEGVEPGIKDMINKLTDLIGNFMLNEYFLREGRIDAQDIN